MKNKLLLGLLIILSAYSCSEDYEDLEENSFAPTEANFSVEESEDKPDVHTKIKLGEKLKNPYTVENMQAAFNYYNLHVPDSPFKNKRVVATHYYIQILPQQEEQLVLLDSLDKSDLENIPVLHDFPLDYEVLQEGDYYVEPTSENDLYHPIFTVIPVDYQFPEDLPYEIIDPVYYPEDEEEYDVETVALFFAGWEEDLRADEIELTKETLPEYLNESRQQQQTSRLFGKRYTPKGRIRIENTDTNTPEDLMKVKVSVGRGIWWKYTYTDNFGNFTAPKKYRGKVRIRLKWRGYTATIRKTWNEILGIQVSDHLMTLTRGGNNRTKTIAYTEPNSGLFGIDLKGGHLWFKGTVHNGLRKYIDYCNQNGINLSISEANVWAWARGGASSTPMLYRYKNLADIALFANVGQANVWQNITAGATTSAINLVPPNLRPDIVFQGLKNKKVGSAGKSNTVRVHQLVFHESGHYSHARKAGRLFWAKNFGATVANGIDDPYSDGSQPSYQAGARIALVEGWGNFTEFKITNFYYNKSFYASQNNLSAFFPADAPGSTNSIERYMENFDVYDRPMQDERFDDSSWFLHGLFWDLLDNRNEIIRISPNITFSQRRSNNGVNLNNIVDNVNLPGSNDFDLSAIFNVLGSNTHDVCDLKNRLLNNHPAMSSALNQLFNSYGYCIPQL